MDENLIRALTEGLGDDHSEIEALSVSALVLAAGRAANATRALKTGENLIAKAEAAGIGPHDAEAEPTLKQLAALSTYAETEFRIGASGAVLAMTAKAWKDENESIAEAVLIEAETFPKRRRAPGFDGRDSTDSLANDAIMAYERYASEQDLDATAVCEHTASNLARAAVWAADFNIMGGVGIVDENDGLEHNGLDELYDGE